MSIRTVVPLPCAPHELSVRVLAYIGDAIYELHVRTAALQRITAPVAALQECVTQRVSATGQAPVMQALLSSLSPEEHAIWRRAHNMKVKCRHDAHARMSTGMEAVLGYLYLQGDDVRLQALLRRMDEIAWGGDAGDLEEVAPDPADQAADGRSGLAVTPTRRRTHHPGT